VTIGEIDTTSSRIQADAPQVDAPVPEVPIEPSPAPH
jgi:hypothetical protein